MRRIKLLLPIALIALFATSTFAQPKAINLERVKMNADIAKELNAIIKANKALLNTLSADGAKAKKMQWREELRDMYGWYSDKSKDKEVAFIKDQLKKANAKKRVVTPTDLTSTTVAFVPRVVEDKGGKTVTIYQQYLSNTQGIAGKKFPAGSIVLPIKNPALSAVNLSEDEVPSKSQAAKLKSGLTQGIKNALKQLASKQSGANADEALPSGNALQSLAKQAITGLNKATYTPPKKSPQQTPIGHDQNDNPIFEKDPNQRVIGHDENDQPVYFNPDVRPNPAYYQSEAAFEKDRKAYELRQDKLGADDFLSVEII